MPNKDYSIEIEKVRQWCITILDYFQTSFPDYKLIADMSKPGFERNVPNNADVLKGFIEGFSDLKNMAKHLPARNFQELNNIFLEKYGKEIK